MKVTGPLFKWFGSKWSAAKHYPPPAHWEIVEPYAGSAGYSLRHAAHPVTLDEINPCLRALWQWLILYATEALIRDIPINIPEGTDIRALGLSKGQALLCKHWQRTNNYGGCWRVSPWGNKPGQWTANTRARVAEEVQAIKHWRLADDEQLLISAYTTYFVDPPYQYNYQYGAKGFDWMALGAKLRALPTPHQIIVCEAVCPKTGRQPGWLPFAPFRSTVTSRRKATQSHHSKELLYHRIAA
jgi:hypothetical protein